MSSDYICFKIGSVARRIQRYYNGKYADLGITAAQSFVLFSLLRNQGQNIKSIAEDVDLDSSAITGLVDRLEKESLVVRRIDPEDRRAFHIYLTSKGELIARKAHEIAEATNQHLRSIGSPEQQEFLDSFLDGMEDYLS
jgi:DNA-binding MarR family transcriptional regulator